MGKPSSQAERAGYLVRTIDTQRWSSPTSMMAQVQLVTLWSSPTVARIATPPIRKTMTNSKGVSCAPGPRTSTRTASSMKKYPNSAWKIVYMVGSRHHDHAALNCIAEIGKFHGEALDAGIRRLEREGD